MVEEWRNGIPTRFARAVMRYREAKMFLETLEKDLERMEKDYKAGKKDPMYFPSKHLAVGLRDFVRKADEDMADASEKYHATVEQDAIIKYKESRKAARAEKSEPEKPARKKKVLNGKNKKTLTLVK